MKKRLVFATNNTHKLEEARRILSDGLEVVSLAEIGCHDEIPETADTLEGNALIKARWVHDRYGCDCFADDTGLMVDALDGAPGVYSARYAGEHCSPADNVAKLLHEMEGETNRDARFATVVALVKDGEEHCFEGSVEGAIAHSPHGNGGFGYDPVFIAKETGKCFAEMSADDKNAISHRGRALRKLREFLGVFLLAILSVAVPGSAFAESWRILSSYDGQMERVIDTDNYVYFLAAAQYYEPLSTNASQLFGTLMRYDKEDENILELNSGNILSGNTVAAIEYNFDKRYLAIAYRNGNVDLLYDNGDLVNIPGLMMADAALSKSVNAISFDNDADLVYLATDFGYVAINDQKAQVETSKVFNTPVDAIVANNGSLLIAVDGKIMKGTSKASNLGLFEDVASLADAGASTANVVRMFPFGKNELFMLTGRRGELKCLRLSPDENAESGFSLSTFSGETMRGMESTPAGLFLSGNYNFTFIRPDGSVIKKSFLGHDKMVSLVSSYSGNPVWFSTVRNGVSLKKYDADSDASKWTVLIDKLWPNVSATFQSASMAYSPEYGMLVRNHGIDQNFSNALANSFDCDDLLSAYKDLTWSRLSTAYTTTSKGLIFFNPLGTAIDPNNKNHVYCGSIYSGLLRLDLSNPKQSIHFSKPSDFKGGYGEPGFAVIVDDPPADAFWPERCLFAPPAFDAYGTLWTTYVNPEPDHGGSPYTELWYWTAENRAATTSASNVRPFGKIRIEGEPTSNVPKILPLTYGSNKNLVVTHGNMIGSGMIVYDHNGTPGNTNDDRMVVMKDLIDQDGLKVSFNYGYIIYEDQQTGLVWIATEKDLFTFDPSAVFTDPQSVRRIKVPRNDGTNLADYLLDGVQVNCIIADSEGHKWFATKGAGLMCTSSDGKEIIKQYTAENSALPSNVLYTICYNPDANSIMISTEEGLCELYLSGASAESSSEEVRAYPNPARPDYHGYVTIDGLPSGAFVKIVDTAGGLVKECGSSTIGEVKWDLTDNSLKKVPAGVYFIIATNGVDADKYSKVGKILVIN